MFNIGFAELVILGIVALVVVGPDQLPALAHKLAQLLNELKRAKEQAFAPIEDFTRNAQVALEKARKAAQEEINLNPTVKSQPAEGHPPAENHIKASDDKPN